MCIESPPISSDVCIVWTQVNDVAGRSVQRAESCLVLLWLWVKHARISVDRARVSIDPRIYLHTPHARSDKAPSLVGERRYYIWFALTCAACWSLSVESRDKSRSRYCGPAFLATLCVNTTTFKKDKTKRMTRMRDWNAPYNRFIL